MLLTNSSFRRQALLRQACLFAFIAGVAFISCSLCRGQESTPLPDAPIPANPRPTTPKPKSFFARWADFYRQDWAPPSTAASSSLPPPARRGPPSPLDSPPFPNSDWSYGGAPVIGEP